MNKHRESDEYRSRSFPVNEEMRFQFFAWKAQTAGIALLFIFILLACLGLFSQGVLSDKTVQTADGRLTISYDRFARNTTDTRFVIHVNLAKDNVLRVNLGGDFLQNYTISSVQPPPESATIQNGVLTLTQPVVQKDSRYSLYITAKPEQMGYFSNSLVSQDNQALSFNQLVYP